MSNQNEQLSDGKTESSNIALVSEKPLKFVPSGCVGGLNVIACIICAAAVIWFFGFLDKHGEIGAAACFCSAMSLFISAHVIKTIEKCAFYLENLNKKN